MADQKSFNPKHIIVVAAFAAFLATFNETYLNVAFAPIMADLGADVNTVQWLATAYMLGAAVMVPVSAFAYRSLPTRPLFCGTVALLVVGSVIAALAPSFPILLVGRIVQSLGTGMLIPIGMNITLEAAPREKLGQYMGIMGAMTTLGPSVSVILAGVLLTVAPWRVLLWVFAGLSLLCLLSGAALLGDIAKLTHPHLDVASVILIGLALVIGPVQSFALSKLDRQLNPHGVTVMSTGFQIAGCIGSPRARSLVSHRWPRSAPRLFSMSEPRFRSKS